MPPFSAKVSANLVAMKLAPFPRTLLYLAALLAAGTARAAVLTGTISQDTTLTGTNQLQGTVVIAPGVVLTFAPGSILQMRAAAVLEVRGQLLAEGTQTAPILFTREVAGQTWKQIKFISAANSRFKFCTFEYANSAGTHLDYYDNDCNPATAFPPRTYHEAVVLLASHADFESCAFRNLPSNSSTAEGDALAIISDDPMNPGAASAHFKACTFTGIGQGIHTRFSYILVEGCHFTGKHGDNDDVDMYGESTPPPLIRYNTFINPAHDDMINPTRCSAIIIGNLISGGDDHGIVLRDAGSPIVMNNIILNCAAAGISVQNQNNALIVNNVIMNSARGVRFFDHLDRHVPPYCLTPGGGRATLINNIIWNCTNSLTLVNASQATVHFSNVQGGQASATVSADSTLTWAASNLNVNPQFDPAANAQQRLLATSPMIDAGTNPSTIAAALAALASIDRDGNPRPLDGNGDGTAAYDIGAYEFFLPTADSNADGIPDGWVRSFGFSPIDNTVANGNPDQDGATTLREYIADTNPIDPRSFFRVEAITHGAPVVVRFQSSAARRYTLYSAPELLPEPTPGTMWMPVPGQVNVVGTGGSQTLSESTAASRKFYRVEVRLP